MAQLRRTSGSRRADEVPREPNSLPGGLHVYGWSCLAAAIYGTNPANGVVLITTKRGGKGTQFEYTGTLSASTITRRPSMLNAGQFRSVVQQYDADNATTYTSQLLNANTDWFDQVDHTGYGQEHSLAFSGAGNNMDYRFSLNYLNQKGIIEATTAERVTLGANYNQRLLSAG